MTKIFLKIIIANPSRFDIVISIEGNPPTNQKQKPNKKMNKIERFAGLQKLVEQYGGKSQIINRPSQIGFFQIKVTLDSKTSSVDSFDNEAYQKLGFFYEGGDTPETFQRNGSEFIFAI
jgi:hypothetical protein